MLNQHWKQYYDPKDLEDWGKLKHTAPPITYPFQYEILHRLLRKYFRTLKGNTLNPESSRNINQLYRILEKTIESLEKAVIEDEAYTEQQESEQWHAQRDLEEDPGAKMLREEEMEKVRREASSKKTLSPIGGGFNMGRYWIDHFGEYFLVGSSDLEHGDWIKHRPHILSEQELLDVDKFKDNYPAFMEELVRDGWIRVSGNLVEMYDDSGLPNLAIFLHSHIPAKHWNEKIDIFMLKRDEVKTVTISDIIGHHFDDSMVHVASKNAVEDTIRYWDMAKNKDFSKYWRQLRKKRRKRAASLIMEAGFKNFINKLLEKYYGYMADRSKQSIVKDMANYSNEDIKNSISELKNAIMYAEDTFGDDIKNHSRIIDFQDLISKFEVELDKRGFKYTTMERDNDILPYLVPKASASNVPNPLRKNYDYSNELCGPEWQNRVKCYMRRRRKREASLVVMSRVNIGDSFSWNTLGGNSYSGKIADIDNEVVYVNCTD